MGLNRVGPSTHGFFSVVNTSVLQDPSLVESADVEPRTPRADYKLFLDLNVQRATTSNPCIVEGSTVTC